MKYLICAALGLGEVVLIIACALIVVSAVITAIVRKVKGKTSCGGDCGYCSSCSHCKCDVRSDDNELNNL